MLNSIIPVILCGGSGTRLWPLSRRDLPKQFAVKREGKSLLELTIERARRLPSVGRLVCVTHEAYRSHVDAIAGENDSRDVLLLEPSARNTAPAMASAALLAARDNPKSILAFMPSDHDFADHGAFQRAVEAAAESAGRGRLTILGISPTYPSTSFGYILPASGIPGSSGARPVLRFVEKPDIETARNCCRSGYLWNSGLVVARADVLIDGFSRHAPDMLGFCRAALDEARRECGQIRLAAEHYSACECVSFDNAVLEREAGLAVVELSAGWSDLGSWTELEKLYPTDDRGNRIAGDAVLDSSSNTFVHSPHRLIVGVGLEDLVVIDTPDAIMIVKRSEISRLRGVVAKLVASDRPEATTHRDEPGL